MELQGSAREGTRSTENTRRSLHGSTIFRESVVHCDSLGRTLIRFRRDGIRREEDEVTREDRQQHAGPGARQRQADTAMQQVTDKLLASFSSAPGYSEERR